MDDYYFSECCGAVPSDVVIEWIGELTGQCSECEQIATFNKDEDMIDWQDEIEYIIEHKDE